MDIIPLNRTESAIEGEESSIFIYIIMNHSKNRKSENKLNDYGDRKKR